MVNEQVTPDGVAPDLEVAFVAVVEQLFDAGSVERTLRRIVQLAEYAVDACTAAGIISIDAGTVRSLAASSAFVERINQLQIEAGEGPCLDAAARTETVSADDLQDDRRWPTFGPSAVETGIRSVLACPLFTPTPSALNLYSSTPASFGELDRAQALLFATMARHALDSAEEKASGEKMQRNFMEALRTRELIGQAQGILMERERVTADQAFAILRQASQHMNIKLREIAAAFVETGERPEIRP